jgi:hypothetical protein
MRFLCYHASLTGAAYFLLIKVIIISVLIQMFKDIFGEPTKDKEGEAHFSYEGIYLVTQYDTTTKEVFGIYLLTEAYEVA